MPYLNVPEVESALELYSNQFPALITRFALPNPTWENRACHAVKIAYGSASGRVGVYFVAGVHAREWVCPDILINFIEKLCGAYSTSSGVTCGGKTFSASQIQSIIEKLDLFVFPQVNPDGRNESQTGDDMWRKNLRPAPPTHPQCSGVDINRNFDFLWDFPRYFHPDVMDAITQDNIANSKDPCDETYIGPSAFSEPETNNVTWIFDQFPHIRYFVDVHSYSELVLYDWGDDDDQTTDTSMTFRNSFYDTTRGIAGNNLYREYISGKDRLQRISLANRLKNAIQPVRGRNYKVQQSFNLYPTAGGSTDYAGSRCFVSPGAETVHAFCIECGPLYTADGELSWFFPPEEERSQIITEITAGLLDFCLGVLEVPTDIYLRDNLADTGAEPTPEGGLSMSPDIHHFIDQLTDPQATLGSPAAKQRDDLFETIEAGQDNYIYVRVQNRGCNSAAADIDVYWTPPSTLPAPGSWNPIGTLHIPSLPPGQLVVAGPLTWPQSQIPGRGHYCFVAVLGTTNDPKPNLNAVQTIDQFYTLIRQNNNVAWKNFDVDDQFAGSMARLDFTIRGWKKDALASDLEIDLSSLPPQAEVELKLLTRVTVGASLISLSKIKDVGQHSLYQVAAGQVAALRSMPLKPSDKSEASLTILLPKNISDGAYDISALQRIGGNELGRVTKRINVGDYPYVGNLRTSEIHKVNCPWAQRMAPHNKQAYRDLQLALRRGFNGCHTCLPEHDTG